ncbi:type II toxin-antitoxin system ChpB family toxin [Acidithiobacillus sp. MC6.1]|nr:type II toxin-antitoxin system ChpB family toxin [Acidithiobacillus sp. MC6.1]
MRWPKRGEIWQADLNPTAGKEQQGGRPMLVMSQQDFNRSGLTLICPITQGGNQARFAGFAVSLMGAGIRTQGVVMCNQPRTIDMVSRGGKFIELVPEFVVSEALAKLQTLLE